VTSLTDGARLALPDRVVPLKKGDVTIFGKGIKHSFQDGTFFAIHGSEPGFDDPDAILELDELSHEQ
jgi:hypothetical protein